MGNKCHSFYTLKSVHWNFTHPKTIYCVFFSESPTTPAFVFACGLTLLIGESCSLSWTVPHTCHKKRRWPPQCPGSHIGWSALLLFLRVCVSLVKNVGVFGLSLHLPISNFALVIRDEYLHGSGGCWCCGKVDRNMRYKESRLINKCICSLKLKHYGSAAGKSWFYHWDSF